MTVLQLESLYHSHGGFIPLLGEGLRFLAENATDTHGDDHGDDHGDGGHGSFGVHITYNDLYNSIVFLTCIYVSGQIASRLLKMPDLVGEIVCGILLGPNLAMFVPLPTTWVLLGEIGLILLVVEAGIDVDLDMLKLIGSRGFLIATVGSFLPIGIGIALAFAMGTDTKGAIAAGAAFGPTSLGIALNILRGGGILNTPVGQLIISAAVIDDMIALIVLSMLETLTVETITAKEIVIPIVSALCYLFIGGYLAIFVAPRLIDRFLMGRVKERYHAKLELAIMFGLVLALMPATYYCKASYLMGVFLAGLVFCSSHGLHALWVTQFKRVLAWLMRIFFAASIGFQVPIKEFASGTVIWQGLVFTVALTGKLAVGFMVPNFTQAKRFTGVHFRDCLMTGFSMAAEGEFAFVIAVYSVDNGLISTELYASVVLAVLISTIIPPFCLRFTISHYNKKAEKAIAAAAQAEVERLEGVTKSEADLLAAIKKNSTFFLCIQTQSESSWGLMHKIMNAMQNLGLDVIDHRSWHPRGINTTLVNEIYCKGNIDPDVLMNGEESGVMDAKIAEVKETLLEAIGQPEVARVRVQRWYPGVVEELVEQEEIDKKGHKKISVQERLLTEATANLEKKQKFQMSVTTGHTVDELLQDKEVAHSAGTLPKVAEGAVAIEGLPVEQPKPRTRRIRQRMRSSPVVGGGLFEDSTYGTQRTGADITKSVLKRQESLDAKEEATKPSKTPTDDVESQVPGADAAGSSAGTPGTAPSTEPKPRPRMRRKMLSVPVRGAGGLFGAPEPSDDDQRATFESFRKQHEKKRDQFFARQGPSGIPAQIHVEGEVINIRISQETLDNLRKSAEGQMVSGGVFGVTMASEDAPVVNMLHGYVRAPPALGKITEEAVSGAPSEVSEDDVGDNNEGKF